MGKMIELKGKVRSSQAKAAIAVNSALIEFYWELGMMISEKESLWGDKLVEQVAQDLQSEFPGMKGLSRRNRVPSSDSNNQSIRTVQQLVAQIPWGHNILIFTSSAMPNQSPYYTTPYKSGGKEKDLESGYNNGADNLVMLVEPDGREFDLAINYNDRKFNEVFTNLNRAR